MPRAFHSLEIARNPLRQSETNRPRRERGVANPEFPRLLKRRFERKSKKKELFFFLETSFALTRASAELTRVVIRTRRLIGVARSDPQSPWRLGARARGCPASWRAWRRRHCSAPPAPRPSRMTPRTKRRLRGVRLRCPLRCRSPFSAPTRTRTCRPRRGETPRATARPPGRCARLRNARAPFPFPSPRASSRSSTRTSDSPRRPSRGGASGSARRRKIARPGRAGPRVEPRRGALRGGGGGAPKAPPMPNGGTRLEKPPPVAPLPSLTWDQHAVFLQFPPTRRATADDLPRGLAPATLTELYRRVEREQRRFFAYAARFDVLDVLENGATRPFRDDPNENESRYRRYRRSPATRNTSSRRRDGARLAEAAFETRPTEPSEPGRRGGAPRRVTAMPSLVALGASPRGRHRETAVWQTAPARRGPGTWTRRERRLRRGSRLCRSPRRRARAAGADAGDAVAARAIDAVSSLSPFCFVGNNETRRVGVALDGAMTAAAFACLASHAPDRRGRAWEVPFPRGRRPRNRRDGRPSPQTSPAVARPLASGRARARGGVLGLRARGREGSARPRRDWSPGRWVAALAEDAGSRDGASFFSFAAAARRRRGSRRRSRWLTTRRIR